MRFSQKIGKSFIRDLIQIESIDKKLENRLWNTIQNDFFGKFGTDLNYSVDKRSDLGELFVYIWQEFYGNLVDEIPQENTQDISTLRFMYYVKKSFFDSQWFEKYDFLEFLSEIDVHYEIGFTQKCNDSLKREMSAYRLVEGSIVQITSEEEILEIEDAILNSNKWEPVNVHLKAAITYFSNRENPDYRNSIKEAISSIESLCVIITGDPKANLGPALGLVEKKYKIHGALKSAFTSLYGFTSDAGGIRHKLLEDDIVIKMEDAKFMLVSCSAFINYLKVKTEE